MGTALLPLTAALRPPAAPPLRTLRAQLLVNLGFVTSAAVLLVGITTALLAGADLGAAAWSLVALWAGSTAVFALFGVHLVDRLLIQPLSALSAEADTLAAGNLGAPTASYGSAELAHLAGRYHSMAADLLDVQSQIVRVEKLAGIGSLAAGVAHEVRNPLGAHATYVDVLRNRGAEAEIVDEMRHAVDRIERTVASLLDYARPGVAADTADLGAAVRTAVDFLDAQGALRGHELTLHVDDAPLTLRGDRHAIEQVAVNFILNAAAAAPASRIAIAVRALRFEPRHRTAVRCTDGTTGGPPPSRGFIARPRRAEIPAGTEGVFLVVADDGPGVSDAHRERIFDPFFTTKEPGRGVGLGLAIVARTVHDAGGLVWVDRAREGGAAFKVFLPYAPARAA